MLGKELLSCVQIAVVAMDRFIPALEDSGTLHRHTFEIKQENCEIFVETLHA